MSAEFWRAPRSERLVIAIDFDGTLVENAPFPEIGPSAGAERWIRELDALDCVSRVLWTVRQGDALRDAVAWCHTDGIPFRFVNCDPKHPTQEPKIHAHVFVDDRAFGVPLRGDSRGRPVVDWTVVGPALVHLAERNRGRMPKVES